MKRREFLKTTSIGLAGTGLWEKNVSATDGQEEETLLLTNGRFITVDDSFSVTNAMAIKGNKIIATGSEEKLTALVEKSVRRIDLEGKTVLPGLIDSHLHPIMAADYEFDHEVPNFETIADVTAFFRQRAKEVPPTEWIGVDYMFVTRLKDRRYPTRKELDDAVSDHPVYFNTGPDMVLNTLGLKKLGFLDGTPKIDVGRIERDSATGEPTGLLRKVPSMLQLIGEATTAFKKNGSVSPEKEVFVCPSLKIASQADRRARLARQLSFYNSVGFTTISPRDEFDSDIALWKELYSGGLGNGGLTCRCPVMLNADQSLPNAEFRLRLQKITESGISRTSDEFWLQGVKFYMDGGMLTGSARMIQPYGVSSIYGITDPEYKGILFADFDKTVEMVRAIFDYGLQPTAHSVGDEAVKTLVDAYAAVAEERSIQEFRPCLSHVNFMNPEIIKTIATHGIVLDMQPVWLFMDGATLLAHFGQDRLKWFQPYRSLIDAGVRVGGGSDHMLKLEPERSSNLYSPFLAMETMLTRRARWTDETIHPEQIVTREEAIRFYTIWNAFILGREKVIGSLEPGKKADFVVIDRDLLTCDVETIGETRVSETWLDGKPVWSRRDADFT